MAKERSNTLAALQDFTIGFVNPIPPARMRVSLPRADTAVTWRQFGMAKKTACTNKSKRLSLLQVAFCLKYSTCSTQRTKRKVVNYNEVHVL